MAHLIILNLNFVTLAHYILVEIINAYRWISQTIANLYIYTFILKKFYIVF